MDPVSENDRPNIPCVILAGGRSRRFGSNKAFAQLKGARLIDLLIDDITLQTSGQIAINADQDPNWCEIGCPLLSDRIQGGLGPLVGIHTAMIWAGECGCESVVTVPVDAPILPSTFVRDLSRTRAPAVAKYLDRVHSVHGIWPVSLANELANDILEGMRAVHKWTAKIDASECAFQSEPGAHLFFNVNTPDDLRRLEQGQPKSPR